MSIKKLYLKKSLSPIRLVAVLGLFVLPMSTMSCSAMKSKSKRQEPVGAARSTSNNSVLVPPAENIPANQPRPAEMVLRVAVVRPAGDDGYITVGFLRSQRFYKIAKDANPVYLELLRNSEKNQSSVRITLENRDSDIIVGVSKVGR